ncbi:hypothetical protein AGABI2DRAFT_138289 [Agaricus bisporus var. bisporus H97]|uniref:hypothetical protein n=1 Tax=Agaricus bisporus var. bisporus (strain H97 / ATCC MYA-4626 / FGSC 10389) TaxID=936046 RepID=UPI00029F6AC8|nr:hypothetical protein AGABI2DRAFT_138289 [Agaricus bisporus var. bisporus H97]EKV44800.1 hypothetical protein AGABI2DRAFT_138289 [Agaricus bisporus var. bisporus H97]
MLAFAPAAFSIMFARWVPWIRGVCCTCSGTTELQSGRRLVRDIVKMEQFDG